MLSITAIATSTIRAITGRELSIGGGISWARTFDSSGNCLTATDPLNHTTFTRTFNSFNEVLTQVCALNHKVVNTYNGTGNLTKTELKDSSNNVLSTTTFVPNADGTVASKTDNNNHTTGYQFNANGHLNRVTTPNNRVTQYTLNTLGVATQRIDALNRTTNFTLDNWNRTTTITYPDSSTKTFQLDPNSNLTQFVDVNGTTTRSYDADNRMTNESFAGSTLCAYNWDAAGKLGLLSSITDASNRTVTYAYTDRNQLYTVADSAGTAQYGYDANGNETSLTNQNSTTVARVFDAANRLTSVTNKNSTGTTLSSFGYGYQDDNLRTSCTESNGDVVSYGYSAAHRLTSESRTGANSYSRSYVVDGVGNRTSQTVGGVNSNFNYSVDDELTSTTGGIVNSYSYNANGEQTNRTLAGTSHTLAFDYDGELTSITQGGATKSFTYDALGRRFGRTAGGTTTRFLYGPGGILLEKQGSTYSAAYTHGNALIRKDGEYPMFDGLGSERTVTNSSQRVTGTAIYEGFGQTVATTGSSSNPYMFAATSRYRNDGDAGLTHVGARYYDAQVGRFVTRDTLLNQHPYLYCRHDPANHVDPSGHAAPGDIKEIAGEILVGLAIPLVEAGGVIAPPVVLIVGIALGIWSIIEDIRDIRDLIGEIGIGNGSNNGDRLGNGGRAGREGPGDLDHMSRSWEHERG